MHQNKLLSKYINATLLFLLGIFYAQLAVAATPDVATMMMNFAQTVPTLMRLVTAVAYIMGMFLIFKGIYGLKQYGEQRTMMSSQHSLGGPLILMVIGTALLYLPSSVQVGLNTFWSEPNPYGYVQDSNEDQWKIIVQDAYLIIQLIGTFAFIRGLLMLTHVTGHGGQPGTFGKALTFMIAGILCINLYEFINVINNTLSLGAV